MDSHRRSIAKALSWRFFATLITATIVFVMTGELVFAAKIGLFDTTVKLGMYYAHERAWVRVTYGQLPPPKDYQI